MEISKIEGTLKHFLQKSHLPDFLFEYMAEMINEEPSTSGVELFDLISDFVTDGLVYSKEEALQICKEISAKLLEDGLNVDFKDTLTAEKLSKPVILNEFSEEKKEDLTTGFVDPFLGGQTSSNFNTFEEKPWAKKNKGLSKKEKREQDALDKKIQEFQEAKEKVPKPIVKHDRSPTAQRDIVMNNLTLTIGGKILLEGTTLKLVSGRKYGLIGRNGIGKTTLLNQIVKRDIDFPKDIHVLHVEQEIDPDENEVLWSVVSCDVERINLMEEEHRLLSKDPAITEKKKKREIDQTQRINQIHERLEQIDSKNAELRGTKILIGLGFTQDDLHKTTSEFSGGWRMRIALAQALFVQPDLLLLDEPTNHLDIDAILWLQEYIENIDNTVIIVSHARDFLNIVAEEIIHFFSDKLAYYKGNYDNFEKVRSEAIRRQKKTRESQSKKVEHIKEFIDRFRYNAKRASLVQSRIKKLQKMEIIDEIAEDPTCIFIFPNPPYMLNPPLLRLDEACIGYAEGKPILCGVNLNIDMDSRIVIVGPNGAGKTTLLKALIGELNPLHGFYYKHNRLRIGLFAQHHIDQLDLRLSPLEQMMKLYPGNHSEIFRSHLGSFGLSGSLALRPMYLLSGGQKSRVAFAVITWTQPHILVMDEPTNHLDIDSIHSLSIALNSFQGGIVVVSHDQYFVSSICSKIMVVRNQKLKEFHGDFKAYKSSQKKRRVTEEKKLYTPNLQ